uniref:Uncharacterized protein n=1 Tax=Anopheles quadriannulatus TaxID=34691 RepID=A0A182XRY5_ANOQN
MKSKQQNKLEKTRVLILFAGWTAESCRLLQGDSVKCAYDFVTKRKRERSNARVSSSLQSQL